VPIKKPRRRPVFGSAREALERSSLTRSEIERALAPMEDAELAEWGLS
jgi:hypothetical protein